MEIRLIPLMSEKNDVRYRLLHIIYCLEDNVVLIARVIKFNRQLNKTTLTNLLYKRVIVEGVVDVRSNFNFIDYGRRRRQVKVSGNVTTLGF